MGRLEIDQVTPVQTCETHEVEPLNDSCPYCRIEQLETKLAEANERLMDMVSQHFIHYDGRLSHGCLSSNEYAQDYLVEAGLATQYGNRIILNWPEPEAAQK